MKKDKSTVFHDPHDMKNLALMRDDVLPKLSDNEFKKTIPHNGSLIFIEQRDGYYLFVMTTATKVGKYWNLVDRFFKQSELTHDWTSIVKQLKV